MFNQVSPGWAGFRPESAAAAATAAAMAQPNQQGEEEQEPRRNASFITCPSIKCRHHTDPSSQYRARITAVRHER